jgi:hypothetical protein
MSPWAIESTANLSGIQTGERRNHAGKGVQLANDGSPAKWRLMTSRARLFGLITPRLLSAVALEHADHAAPYGIQHHASQLGLGPALATRALRYRLLTCKVGWTDIAHVMPPVRMTNADTDIPFCKFVLKVNILWLFPRSGRVAKGGQGRRADQHGAPGAPALRAA